MENTSDLLRHHNIKPSFTRVMIYDFLKSNMNHPTVEEIFQALNPVLPTLSKTTVYNTLDLFIEKHLVQALLMQQQKHYDLITHPHAHFKCDLCDAIIDLDVQPPKLDQKTAQDYSVYTAQLVYRGVCKECQKNAPKGA